MICVDCDRTITGPAVVAAPGDSMSGARPDAYAHPPGSKECQPPPRKRALRQALDAAAAGIPERRRRTAARKPTLPTGATEESKK